MSTRDTAGGSSRGAHGLLDVLLLDRNEAQAVRLVGTGVRPAGGHEEIVVSVHVAVVINGEALGARVAGDAATGKTTVGVLEGQPLHTLRAFGVERILNVFLVLTSGHYRVSGAVHKGTLRHIRLLGVLQSGANHAEGDGAQKHGQDQTGNDKRLANAELGEQPIQLAVEGGLLPVLGLNESWL